MTVFLKYVQSSYKYLKGEDMDNRKTIFKLLRESSGRWVSGQAIADELEISRNAVSKHVKLMRDNGVKILASTNRGYRFMDAEDKIYPYEIMLNNKKQLIGNKIYLYKKLDSTNSEVARQVIKKQIKEGSVIIAENQSKGKGRNESDWLSIKGKGIYLSIYLNPRCVLDKVTLVNLIAGYSFIETMKKVTGLDDFKLTWPNNITYKGQKFAGILAESFTDMEGVGKTVLGLGAYVNLSPKELKAIADQNLTSLNAISDTTFNRNDIISVFLNIFNDEYLKFKNKEINENLDRWVQYLDILNKNVQIDIDGIIHKGYVKGITDKGKLIFSTEEYDKDLYIRYGDFIIS
jgi:BirA family biotin operon repressor/biotin-[acetyl-CoA-carboxylase] ligase